MTLADTEILDELFGPLDADSIAELEAELERVRLSEGDVLVRQGDPGESMYVLVRGRLGVAIADAHGRLTSVDERGPGSVVGEMALLTGRPRAATVRALEDAELLKLSSVGFGHLADRHPHILSHLTQAMVPRLERAQLADMMAGLFGPLDAADVEDLQARLKWLHLAGGSILFRQGDPGDAMYIVINGRLRYVVEDEDGTKHVLGEVGAGETIGEFALLTDELRSATVYAVRDSTVVQLSREEFGTISEAYPQVLMEIARKISQRRQRAIRRTREHPTTAMTFAVMPICSSVPLADFAARLAEAVAAFGPTLHLNSPRFDSEYGKPRAAQTPQDHPFSTVLAAWLSEQERTYSYIIYETDLDPSPWTERCLRQADRILLLADGASDPDRSGFDVPLARWMEMAHTEIVLLQPAQLTRPRGTRVWLDRYPVDSHHHLRMQLQQDWEHLSRQLTGHAVGLVLGGGGARGCAHLGVYDALLEAGIPVDLVGGTSMGAILSATIALGFDYQTHMELLARFSSPLTLFDPTVPSVSLFASAKVTQVLQSVFGDTQIEDLWRPFFCISSNLTRATQMIHRRGPLWQAVRASMSIPGIFSPVLYEDELLVDGCVLNNLPIDVMDEAIQGGPIIAVNVFPDLDLVKEYDFGPSVSGWRTLVHKLNPLDRHAEPPLIFETLLRVVALNDVHQAKTKRALADLYIRPPVDQFNILDFGSYAAIAEIGYQAAREALADWQGEPSIEGGLPAPVFGRSSTPLVDELSRTLQKLEKALAQLETRDVI